MYSADGDIFNPPCTPNCEQVPWNGKLFIGFTGFDNCQWIAAYYWRFNTCNNEQEIQIVNIGTPRTPCNTDNGKSMEYRELVWLALYNIARLNPMGFAPQVGTVGCAPNWRVTLASCWMHPYQQSTKGKNDNIGVTPIEDTGEPDIIDYIIPCQSLGCCSQPIVICRDAFGIITVTPLNTQLPENCNNGICYSVCNPHTEFKMKDKVENGEAIHVISTQPLKDRSEVLLNIETTQPGTISLQLSNVGGKLLNTYFATITKGKNTITIPSLNLSESLYLCKIYFNGQFLQTEKFSIEK